MHIIKQAVSKLKSLWERKLVKVLWVVIVAASCFVLGYTLKPRPSRETMLRGAPPAFNVGAPFQQGMPQFPAGR